MTVNEIEINTGMLNRTISDMRGDMEIIKKSAEDIYTEIQELDAMWDGPANQAFQTQFNADRNGFLTMCNQIEAYIRKMELAKNEYDKCENKVEMLIHTIKV